MLKTLKIKNFRSIVNAELTFGRVNLFIGPNGGGKSNFLEAIGIVSAALGRSIEPKDLDLKGVRLSLPRLFKATFKNRAIPKGFSITAETENTKYATRIVAGDRSTTLQFSHESLQVGGKTLLGRAPRGKKIHIQKPDTDELSMAASPGPTRGILDAYRSFVVMPPEAHEELNHLESYAIYAPQTAVLRGIATDSRIVEPLGLTGGRLAVAMSELLRTRNRDIKSKESEHIMRCLAVVWEAGWPDEIKIDKPLSTVVPPQVPTGARVLYLRDRYMRVTRSWLSAFDASEGTLYLLFVAALLAHPRAPRIFALDNVDGTLNPRLVRKLVEFIVEVISWDKSFDRQVFLTSHNPTALDAIDLFDDEQRVYVVRRNTENGRTEFRRVEPPKEMTREEWIDFTKGRNTSALWLEGMIEGALND